MGVQDTSSRADLAIESQAAPAPAPVREKKRRRRTRPHEVNILMSAYVQNAFPNEKTRERLAEMVGMTPRYVRLLI